MPDGSVRLYAFVAFDAEGRFEVTAASLARDANGRLSYPAVTSRWPAAQAFEREIAEQFGVVPVGHPLVETAPLPCHTRRNPGTLGGLRSTNARSRATIPSTRLKARRFTRLRSDRCMPASLNRGISAFSAMAKRFCTWRSSSAINTGVSNGCSCIRMPHVRRSSRRTIAGDASIGHALAYCTALEALSGTRISLRAGRDPRHRPGARTAGQSCRRSRRTLHRRRVSASVGLSWSSARRVPEPYGGNLRQPVRPQPAETGRRLLRHSAGAGGANAAPA